MRDRHVSRERLRLVTVVQESCAIDGRRRRVSLTKQSRTARGLLVAG